MSADSDDNATRAECRRCQGSGQFTQQVGASELHYPICPTCMGLGKVWGHRGQDYGELIARHARDLVLLVHADCVAAALAPSVPDEERQRRLQSLDEVTRLTGSLPNAEPYVRAFRALRESPAFIHPRSRAATLAKFKVIWPLARVSER